MWCSSNSLLGKRFRQFVKAAEVDAVGDRRQFQPRHLERVELFGALGARGDPGGVLDRLGQQAGEVGVGEL